MMESKKKVFSLYDIVMIGLMAAVVFVVTMFLSIRIPTPTGTTMIKLANAFVLLCGLLRCHLLCLLLLLLLTHCK